MATQAEFQTKVTKAGTNMDRLDGILNGPATGPNSLVQTDSGAVKTLARVIAEMGAGVGLVTQALVQVAITDKSAFRNHLELGDASTKSVGTGSGSVAAGDDIRFDEIAQKADQSDLDSLQQDLLSEIELKANQSAVDALQQAVSTAGGLGANRAFTTKSLMDADLSAGASTLAIVYADSIAANNGVYVKVGGSGTGSWSLTNILTAADTALLRTGGVMAGNVDMDGHYVYGLPTPLQTDGAAPKGYVDGRVFSEQTRAMDAETYLETKLDLSLSQGVTFVSPLVVQRDYDGTNHLMIPKAFGFRKDYSFQAIDPTLPEWGNGSAYRIQEVLPFDSSLRYHLYDFNGAETGSYPFVVNGAGPHPIEGYGYDLVGTSCNGRFDSRHLVVGGAYGGCHRNIVNFTIDPTLAPRVFWTTEFAPVTDIQLTARGLTSGFYDPTNNIPTIGDDVPAKHRGAPYCFFRVFVQTDVDDDFGLPKYFFFNSTGGAGGGFLKMELKLSPRAAIFSLATRATEIVDYFLVGCDTNSPSTANVICAGVQAAFDDKPVQWVDWFDRDGGESAGEIHDQNVNPEFIFPPLYAWAGKTTKVYPQAALPQMPDGGGFRVTVSALADDVAAEPIVASGDQELVLAPSEEGVFSGEIILSKPDKPKIVWKQPFSLTAVDATQTGTKNVLMIGDSLTNRFLPEAVATRLQRAGITPNMVGTIPAFHRGGTAYLGEGREGRRFSHYTYELAVDDCKPIPPGGEATYLALDPIAKMYWNPFIRAATGGDNPDYVFNGFIFDLAFYLSRFALATPDAIVIQLGENDLGAGTHATTIPTGLRVLYERIRADFPSVPIAFSAYSVARMGSQPDRWMNGNHRHIVGPIWKFVRERADSALQFLPTYLRQNPYTGWPLVAVTTDTEAGRLTATIDNVNTDVVNGVTYGLGGDVHPLDLNVRLAADQIAAWVAS